MAIKLEDKTNVIAPNGTFPYGELKDDTGANDGVPYDKATNSDYFQFFARLLDQSAIIANGLLESATDGYQYFQALVKIINFNYSAGVIETENGNLIRTAEYEIVNWDMDADSTFTITHGITDPLTKVRSVSVLIRPDSAEQQKLSPLFEEVTNLPPYDLSGTTLNLRRLTGGYYDSSEYDEVAGYVRGWVKIEFK